MSVTVPPAPAIRDPKLAAMSGLDERGITRIGAPVVVLERELVGEGNDPLWNYSGLFDNREMADAIDLALVSNSNSKVTELGGQVALSFVERLEALNASLSDLPADAGIPASPIRNVISGYDFRYQIAMQERGIAAGLEESPGISKAYIDWLFKVADMVKKPNHAEDGKGVP